MLLCGIDEAGRGPLAGPVVAAAVIIDSGKLISGVKDSKKISGKQREILFGQIVNNCLEYNIQVINNNDVDDINILNATMIAMENCIDNLLNKAELYLIDGNYFKLRNNKHNDINFKTIVKGDEKIYEISCASILAKVQRDRIMIEYDKQFPQYGFIRNKGYGTKEHIQAIKKYGLCSIHRKTFVKNIITEKNV